MVTGVFVPMQTCLFAATVTMAIVFYTLGYRNEHCICIARAIKIVGFKPGSVLILLNKC